MKSIFTILLAIVVAIALSEWTKPLWADDDTIAIQVEPKPVTEEQQAEASNAIQRLIDACPQLKSYNADLTWLTASTDESQDVYLQFDHGAEKWVSIAVRVNNDADVPASWRAHGHTLTYAVLPDRIYINKDIGGWFCDVGRRSGFKPTGG